MGTYVYEQRRPVDADINMDWVKAVAKNCDTYPVLIYSLLTRGIRPEDIETVLKTGDVPDIRLNGVFDAAKIIARHIREGNKIRIFADYDCDGITSGYVMYRGLCDARDLSQKESQTSNTSDIAVKFPQRSEGYGLSRETALQWATQDVNLVITVDNGITKKDEVSFLIANDVDVIVTDHHEPQKGLLPERCAIVDPCYSSREYSGLAGVAVAWVVIKAVFQELSIGEPEKEKYLPAVMTGTISDVMPMTWYNAGFIREGLRIINERKKEVPYLFGLFGEDEGGPLGITATDIGFSLAPRINAASRLNDVRIAGATLCSGKDDIIEAAYKRLKDLNDQRKSITKKAAKDIAETITPYGERFATFCGKDYPKGIHGILAGEMTKRYPDYPCFVYVQDGNVCHGSIRCNNEGIDTLSMLKESRLIESCGGHGNACVMSIKRENLERFIAEFSRRYDSMDIPPVVRTYDAKTSLAMLNNDLLIKISQIPYTPHDMPVFCVPGILIISATPSKSNPSNLKFHISDNTASKYVWAWGFAEKYKTMGEPKAVTIICEICQDFMARDKIRATLRIIDMLPEEHT